MRQDVQIGWKGSLQQNAVYPFVLWKGGYFAFRFPRVINNFSTSALREYQNESFFYGKAAFETDGYSCQTEDGSELRKLAKGGKGVIDLFKEEFSEQDLNDMFNEFCGKYMLERQNLQDEAERQRVELYNQNELVQAKLHGHFSLDNWEITPRDLFVKKGYSISAWITQKYENAKQTYKITHHNIVIEDIDDINAYENHGKPYYTAHGENGWELGRKSTKLITAKVKVDEARLKWINEMEANKASREAYAKMQAEKEAAAKELERQRDMLVQEAIEVVYAGVDKKTNETRINTAVNISGPSVTCVLKTPTDRMVEFHYADKSCFWTQIHGVLTPDQMKKIIEVLS